MRGITEPATLDEAKAEIERLWDALALANAQIAMIGAAKEKLVLNAERYAWEREHPAWESEAYLSGVTPEEYDAAIDKARGVMVIRGTGIS